MIFFGAEDCQDFSIALELEWLETNGLGGFASSTICGLNTRRYHGLLTAALNPPTSRYVLLSKLEETFVLNGRAFELATNCYPGAVHPAGFRLQSSFRQDPFPVFSWQIEDIELNKTVFLVHGENTVVVRYLLRAQGAAARHNCTLHVRPLIAFRDFHQLTHANGSLNGNVAQEDGLARIQPYPDLPPLYFAHDAESCEPAGEWYRNFEYVRERERSLDFAEDLYQPFTLHFDLSRGIQATVIASLSPRDAADAADLRNAERDRRRLLPSVQTDRYLVKRGEGKSVIAGYHWFADWGRDTMISLPGLFSGTAHREAACEILLQFAQVVSEGMLPNRFPDSGAEPEYNNVDGTLWFFEAIRAVLLVQGERKFVRERLFPTMSNIVEHHLRGTRFGIHATPDGLLHAGEPGTQLTWMDARSEGREVTPRAGKPVEIQALWYNALCIMADLAPEGPYAEIAQRAKSNFAELFWNPATNFLNDVVCCDGTFDASLRPNQIFAIGLKHKILDDEAKTRAVLEAVERKLLTPYGLRTLSPDDPRYRGRYEGDSAKRDGAYHQGTVWPWLMGTFVSAYLDAYGHSETAREQARGWLRPLAEYRDGPGLGNLPEIFDGDEPQTARGTIAQAWSIAELQRCLRLVS